MNKEEIAKKLFESSWTYEIPKESIQCEYGSVGNIGFTEAEMVDAAGNVVEIPRCEKCNDAMQIVIGREVFTWLCMNCDREERGFGRF